MGPLWDVGQVSQRISILDPPFAGAASKALVAFL